jgi:hypothetical protein
MVPPLVANFKNGNHDSRAMVCQGSLTTWREHRRPSWDTGKRGSHCTGEHGPTANAVREERGGYKQGYASLSDSGARVTGPTRSTSARRYTRRGLGSGPHRSGDDSMVRESIFA